MSTEPILTPWRKRQVAMLYRYASMEYLRPLHGMVSRLIALADGSLDQAKAEGRDTYLTDPRWGVRDTAANWSTHAYPFLLSFRENVAYLIAARASEVYGPSGTHQCAMALGEFSMNWSTLEEEERFDEMFREIGRYSYPMDRTMNRSWGGNWDDHSLALQWKKAGPAFGPLPVLRVRTDIVGETRKRPPRTGVYIPADDSFGTPEFAWTGLKPMTVNGVTTLEATGCLSEGKTFNDLGKFALETVGRDALWLDDDAMFAFATRSAAAKELRDKVYVDGEARPEMAALAVSNAGIVRRPCEWHYVELIEGEFEAAPPPVDPRLRAEPGDTVPRSGWWHTLAIKGDQGFRYFEQGSRFPETKYTDWGSVIWSFDPDHQPKK